MPKAFPKEFKDRAVRLVLDHEGDFASRTEAITKVSKQVGASYESLRRWIAQAETDAGGRPGPTSQELAEIKALKAEVRRLREANEILKAAAIFFVGELDPRTR